MSKLKIVVLYDRVLVDEDEASPAGDKGPVTRTLDKKEVEEEVAEALRKHGSRRGDARARWHARRA